MSARPIPHWCAGLVLLLAASCSAPAPRIPFERGGWHVTALGGQRFTGDRFHGDYTVAGIQYTTLMPETHGWGWDVAFRYGTTSGTDSDSITNPPPDQDPKYAIVQNEKDSDIYEISFGVRQTYWPDAVLQPYAGAGAAFFATRNDEQYTGTDDSTAPIDFHNGYRSKSFGMYLSTGLLWRVLRDQFGEGTEGVVDLNLRGMYTQEFNFVEVSLGFGIGR